jgi:hypothetical protein
MSPWPTALFLSGALILHTVGVAAGFGSNGKDVETLQVGESKAVAVAASAFVPEPGFKSFFDERSLNGWEGRQGFWTVED